MYLFSAESVLLDSTFMTYCDFMDRKKEIAEIYFPTFPKSEAETAGNALNRRKT
jgi:hypothetical protein